NWCINKTRAQSNGFLLVSPDPSCQDDKIDTLGISVGNASMNLRALIDWGIVYKTIKNGNRKEYYEAEKDMWIILRQVIIARKKRELEPLLDALNDLSDVEENSPDAEAFKKVVCDIKVFSCKANSALNNLSKSDSNWLMGTFLKLVK
nr:transcriptional regulator [Saprospiraceae bacterium]